MDNANSRVACNWKQYIYRHYPNWGWPHSLLPYFWQINFWQCVDQVNLPPSTWIFDKTMQHKIMEDKSSKNSSLTPSLSTFCQIAIFCANIIQFCISAKQCTVKKFSILSLVSIILGWVGLLKEGSSLFHILQHLFHLWNQLWYFMQHQMQGI